MQDADNGSVRAKLSEKPVVCVALELALELIDSTCLSIYQQQLTRAGKECRFPRLHVVLLLDPRRDVQAPGHGHAERARDVEGVDRLRRQRREDLARSDAIKTDEKEYARYRTEERGRS